MTTLLDSQQPADTRSPSDSCVAPQTPGHPAVALGRRLHSDRWPTSLQSAGAIIKKVMWTALEARMVTDPVGYAYRELAVGGIGEYTLRGSQTRFTVRHRSGDVDIFRKFYAYRYYEWPSEVRNRLATLGRPINTLDLGANIGFFEVHTREQVPVGRAIALEPDAANGGIFERTRDANHADWELHRVCASNQPGVVRFRSGAHNFSRISGDGDITSPAIDVYPYIDQVDFVKMNIEGSEWEILQDARLAATDVVWIVEYHRIRNPEPAITEHVQRLFHDAGYATWVAVGHDDNGLVWAWKAAAA